MITKRQQRLLDLVRGAETAPARVLAANQLGGVGDPRFRADRWMLPDDPWLGFVRIPAGPFLFGAAGPNGHEEVEEQRGEERDLPEYYIGRWPVTVAQFDRYHDAIGKTELGPYSVPGGAGPHHPVVYVTWSRAVAYTCWLESALRAAWPDLPSALRAGIGRLARRGDWSLALPSEAEWEKAARGTDGRQYPWGFHFDEDCVNVGELTSWTDWYPEERVTQEIGGTSPVGCYPRGASPFGVEDMLGNVFEWMRGDDEDISAYGSGSSSRDPLDARIIRGGGYDIGCQQVITRTQRVMQPFEDVGFRLVIVGHV